MSGSALAASPAAAAVKAVRSAWWFRQMAGVFAGMVRRNFAAVRVLQAPPALTGPIIIASNHPSWWDPISFVLLHRHFFGERPAYGPMDEVALGKYPLFKKLGIFGIAPESARGARQMLSIGRGLLADPTSVLWVTVPGHFADVRAPLVIKPGLLALATPNLPARIVPLALEYVFWQEKKPELLANFGTALPLASTSPDQLQAALTATMQQLQTASIAQAASQFQTLQLGQAGVGGPYEWLRRVQAWRRGEKYVAAHAAIKSASHGDK